MRTGRISRKHCFRIIRFIRIISDWYMLIPRKVKHRKMFRAPKSGRQIATQKTSLAFGAYGLKAMTSGWLTSRQLEAGRRAIVRHLKRGGKIWIRVYPDKPITKKGSEIPMGGGKGSVDHYVTPVRPGTVVFELDGIDEATARESLRLAGHKLPVQTKFIDA